MLRVWSVEVGIEQQVTLKAHVHHTGQRTPFHFSPSVCAGPDYTHLCFHSFPVFPRTKPPGIT